MFEGVGGSGKTTVSAAAAKILSEAGYHVTRTHQPGGSRVGAKIRDIALNPEFKADIDASAQLFLYAADRHINIQQVIKPALKRGDIVLCDRYDHSTRAYQAAGGGDPAALEIVNDLATGGLRANRTYWFDLPPEMALERIRRAKRGERDRFDLEKLAFWQKLQASYAEQTRRHPEEMRRIDASAPIETVTKAVLTDLLEFIKRQGS